MYGNHAPVEGEHCLRRGFDIKTRNLGGLRCWGQGSGVSELFPEPGNRITPVAEWVKLRGYRVMARLRKEVD